MIPHCFNLVRFCLGAQPSLRLDSPAGSDRPGCHGSTGRWLCAAPATTTTLLTLPPRRPPALPQAVFVFLLLPVTLTLRRMSLTELPGYVARGWQCCQGLTPACGSDCSGAPLLPLAYIALNLAFNVCGESRGGQLGSCEEVVCGCRWHSCAACATSPRIVFRFFCAANRCFAMPQHRPTLLRLWPSARALPSPGPHSAGRQRGHVTCHVKRGAAHNLLLHGGWR